jgi:hypothetical protein
MTDYILNEEKKVENVDPLGLYYYCRVIFSLMSKYPVRVPRILGQIERFHQKVIHFLPFECIQELLVKYWSLQQNRPDLMASTISLNETSSCHQKSQSLPAFSVNLWTELLLINLGENDLYASMLLSQLETAPKATLLRGISFSDYFWPALEGPKADLKLTMLGLGIAFLSLYQQTTDSEYKVKIHEFIASITTKRLGIIGMLLQDFPITASLPNPIGKFQRCGPLRLKAVEFVAELAGMCISAKELLVAIRDSDIIKLLLEMFHIFPWNNFLHAALTDTILFLLDSDLAPYMLEELHLLQELLTLDRQVDVGYKGHLMILFDKLCALGVEEDPFLADAWTKEKTCRLFHQYKCI